MEIENSLKAREQLKLGNVPQVERWSRRANINLFSCEVTLKQAPKNYRVIKLFMDLNLCFLQSVDGLHEVNLVLVVNRPGYLSLVKTCFGKFANDIDVLTFNLAHRLVP